jgi:general secretion pathway protein F
MRFDVRALSGANRILQLSVDAGSEEEAVRQLEQQSLKVFEIKPARSIRVGPRAAWGKFSLLLFSQELMALLRAGLNLMEALQGLVEKETGSEARTLLERLIAQVRSGQRFSHALAEFPATFPPLFVGLVLASESTGDLPKALARYIDYRQRVDQVRGKAISASIYPAILLLVGGGVTLFLGGYVVPRFATIYEDTGRELPAASRIMISWGRFADQHLAAIVVSAAVIAAILAWATIRAARSGALSAMAAKLPWVGQRLHLYELSRLYLTLGLLLDSGIPVVTAISMSRGVVSAGLRGGLDAAREQIQAGEAFSVAFEQRALTTPISVRMLRVGERSGQLGEMLIEAAAFYEGAVARFIDRFVRVFEPALMAIIGIIVGGIVLLLYMPIFDLAGSIQ